MTPYIVHNNELTPIFGNRTTMYACDDRSHLGAGCRLREAAAHTQVSSILSTMRWSVSFSRAAATLSLSPSCLVT